jgi:uncharacterized membrane protein YesL
MFINLVGALSVLLILPGPPAIFGIYYVANELVHGRLIGMNDLLVGARRYALKSWLWAIINIIIALLAWNGLQVYRRMNSDIGTMLQLFIIAVVAVWCIVQFYALPYLMEQQDKRLWLAWRNGLFTAFATPLFTLLVVILAVVIIAVSVASVALVFLGGICLLAIFGTRVMFNRLDTFGVRERDASRNNAPESNA